MRELPRGALGGGRGARADQVDHDLRVLQHGERVGLLPLEAGLRG